MEKPKKKKKYTKTKVACACAALIAAAAFMFGDQFGLPNIGSDGGAIGLPMTQQLPPAPQPESPPVEAPADPVDVAAEPELLIRVYGDQVFHGEGSAVALTHDQLRDVLLEWPEHSWTLRGERAILDTIEGVRNVFREVGVSFAEVAG